MNEFDDERPMVLGCGRALLRNRVAASNPEGHNQYTGSLSTKVAAAVLKALSRSSFHLLDRKSVV